MRLNSGRLYLCARQVILFWLRNLPRNIDSSISFAVAEFAKNIGSSISFNVAEFAKNIGARKRSRSGILAQLRHDYLGEIRFRHRTT